MTDLAARLLALVLFCAGLPFALVVALVLRLRGTRLTLDARAHLGRGGSVIALRSLGIEPRDPSAGAQAPSGAVGALQAWLRLLDVAAGRLSIVGPRPRRVGEALPPHLAPSILAVKPGIVGLWHVRSRTNVAYESEDETDREYVAQRSARTDLGIALRAALTAPFGSAAQRVPMATEFFGIRHLNLSLNEIVDLIAVALQGRRRVRMAFVNPDCVNLAHRDPIYRAALTRFDWVLTDGIGMNLAGRLLGQPVRQNVNGTDLFPRLLELLESNGRPLYLLGGRPGVAAAVAEWIGARYPRVQIAGHHHGYFGPEEQEAVIRGIREAGTAVLLVGFGAPRQERWIAAHSTACGAVVTLGVGGLFDYYSGRVRRAPKWLRELGGEWLYRLIQEPQRLWRRYLVGNAVFLFRVIRARALSEKGTP